jgi:Na+/proline symporter
MSPENIMLSLSGATIFILLITLSAASFVYSRLWRESNLNKAMGKKMSEEFFVTARKAGSTWLLTGAFYSGLSGAWLPMTSAYYGATYGVFGIVTSSLLLGTEAVLTALASRAVALTLPTEVSLPASIRTHYGRVLELYTLAVMALSELTCLASEYICIAATLFELFAVPTAVTIPIFASFSVFYTLFGGALVGNDTAVTPRSCATSSQNPRVETMVADFWKYRPLGCE